MVFFDIFKRKKTQKGTIEMIPVIEGNTQTIVESQKTGLSILLEQLPTTYGVDETSLIEITDSNILAKIDGLVPSIGSMGVSVDNAIKNLNGQQGERLYRVVLQKGGRLVDSNNISGAKRAFTMVGNHIGEHADLIAVDQVVDKGAVVANVWTAVMGVSSMVVGQYYMHQVDHQLSLISDHISRITDFLDIQYKSQVASLIESIYNISKFQISSIENEEVRGRELDNIQLLRGKCQELLNQAEVTLENLISKSCPTYDDYEKNVKEIGKWSQYQIILIKLLYQINILDFTLHLGVKSKEQCFGSFTLHTGKMKSIHTQLITWHNTQCQVLKIDIAENRRKHTGFLARLEKPISWINDDWNYQAVREQMVRMIKEQTSELTTITYTNDNLFNEDVQIIARDGKYYYLPTNNSK